MAVKQIVLASLLLFLHDEAACARHDVTRRVAPPSMAISGLDPDPVPLNWDSSTAVNTTLASASNAPLLAYTPWPAQWPRRTHVLPQELNLQYTDSQIQTIDVQFSRPGRNCVCRGQNILARWAFVRYLGGWPEMPSSHETSYYLHGEEYTEYLGMIFAASDELWSHDKSEYLWHLTARVVQWLGKFYNRHGCKTSQVRATVKWIDGKQTALGDFALVVAEPPAFHPTEQWPPVPSFPFKASIPTFESSYPQTCLHFLDQATAEHRSYWGLDRRPGHRDYVGTDADPLRQEAMLKALDQAIEWMAKRREQAPENVVRLTTLNFHGDQYVQDISIYFLCDRAQRGWRKDLLMNVLTGLRDMVARRGILRDVVDVYYHGVRMGHVTLLAP